MPLINPQIGKENIQLGYFYPHRSYQNQTANPPYEEWALANTGVAAFSDWWTASVSGAASAVSFVHTVQDRPGIIQILAGTAAAAAARVVSSQSQGILLPIASGLIEWEQSARLSIASSANPTYVARMGLADPATATGDVTDGLYFEATGNVWFACSAAGGSRTKVSTGVAPTIGGWQIFNIRSNRSGAQEFYIDDALVASISATLPSAAGNLTNVMPGQIVKSAGATTANIQIDYSYFAYSFGGAR